MILSNPYYREKYDNDRDTKDPFSSNNMFFTDLAREPNYEIKRDAEGTGIVYEQRIPNVGVWVSNENKKRLEVGRNDILAEVLVRNEIGVVTEELEWEYDRVEEFLLVQRQKRLCRTGWWVEVEKLADLCLDVSGSALFKIEGADGS